MVANLRVEEWHSVHQRLHALAKRRAELDAEEARCLRDAERVELWRWLGYVHLGEYLERELGYSPHPGAERLRVARALGELPQLEAALQGGLLLHSVVRELTRVATRETEAEWIAAARGKTVRQLEVAVAGRKRGDRPGDPTTPELVTRIVRFELSPDVFALLRQAQSALADEHGGQLDDSAFIHALCRRALEGAGSSDVGRPAHQIAVTVCESCKRGWQNGAGREIEVGPEVIERARCDAEQIGSLEDAQPARVTSTVTPRIRRQVLARDHHRCTVPGCRSARNLDLHHIRYQRDGGSHELSNITVTCAGHHRQLHEGALTIRGRAPDDLQFTWRDANVRAPGVLRRDASTAGAADMGPAQERSVVVEPARAQVGAVAVEAGGAHVARVKEEAGGVHVGRAKEEAGGVHVGRATEEAGGADMEPMGVEPVRAHAGPVTDARRSHMEPAVSRRDSAAHGVAQGDVRVGSATQPRPAANVGVTDSDRSAREARSALTTAGYSPREARLAVEQAQAHVGRDVALEHLLREALRCCRRSS